MPDVNTVRLFRGIRDTLTQSAEVLRAFFRDDEESREMGLWHAAKDDDSKLWIRTIFDDRPVHHPQITVGLSGTAMKFMGFGGYEEEFIEDDTVYAQYGGRGGGQVVLTLESLAQRTRLELLDMTLKCLLLHWEEFASLGIITLGNPNFGGFTDSPYQAEPSRQLHAARISMPFEYEWIEARVVAKPPYFEGVTADAEAIVEGEAVAGGGVPIWNPETTADNDPYE